MNLRNRDLRKITVNVPDSILQTALRITGLGITETVHEALKEIEKREKRSILQSLRGKISFGLDLPKTRR